MKFLILLLLVGCTSQEREAQQGCELKCTECKFVELKCDAAQKQDDKDVGK